MINECEIHSQICYRWTSCPGCPAGLRMGYVWSSPEVLVVFSFLDLLRRSASLPLSSSLIVTSFPPSSPSSSRWKSLKWLLRWEQKKDKDIVEFKFANIKDPSETFSSEYAVDFLISDIDQSSLFDVQKSEYIFTLLEGDSDESLLGLRLSPNKLHFLQKGHRRRVTFKAVGLDDNRWHTVVLAVTGRYTILTVDCGTPLEL